ncbi:MAG: DNA mismatch repair endonuclease MutL [Eubacteriales bacterium]
MAEINILDSSTIDKIAAGEVVERPASVVKELVENAVDAGATAISVEIKEGGISLIRVTDNGSGIHKSQIRKAFLRHATSKIKTVDDLIGVSSLGFRGEALSSIAAVSRMEMMTKTAEDLVGLRYVVEGAMEKEYSEVGVPEGTTILVHNLFYNTPVRRKFLKTPATEGAYISDLCRHLALAKPHISFQFINNGVLKFNTSGNGDLKEIIYRIYGRETTNELVYIEKEMDNIKICGYLGKPVINRSNRSYETYFINGRYLKSSLLAKAIEEGYKNHVMQHKFPFVVLHFKINGKLLDVNVHPTKMDIRFSNPVVYCEFISSSIVEALLEKELIPTVTLASTKPLKVKESLVAGEKSEPFETKRLVKEDFHTISSNPVVANSITYEKSSENSIIGNNISQVRESNPYSLNISSNTLDSSSKIDVTQNTFKRMEAAIDNIQTISETINAVNVVDNDKLQHKQLELFEEKILSSTAVMEYQIIGQVFDTYWLISYKNELLFVDQHAAHEKVKYEALIKKLQEENQNTQMLEPPIILSLSGKEETVLEEFKEYFNQLGFFYEEFGNNTIALRNVPLDLYGTHEKKFFLEILDQLIESPLKGNPKVILEKMASMACKSAVKGNQSMQKEEMHALVGQLLTLENPYLCPHGRPTIISMSKKELEKKFKRVL